MTCVHFIGGSNTLLKDGWAQQVAALLPDHSCQNRSVGATNSAMAYFRLSVGLDVGPGDAIVWEYAINDENWIDRDKDTVENTLKYVELCIKLAIRRSVSFIPVILASREYSARNRRSPYADGLTALFAAYGIDPIRATELYCAKHGVAVVPNREYDNNKHYTIDSEVLTLVADAVARRVRAPGAPPQAPDPAQGPQEEDVVFFTDFTDCQSFEFRNSVMALQVSRPDQANLMKATMPAGNWRVAGVLLLKTSRPERFKLWFDDDALVVSLTNPLKNNSKPRLTFLPVNTADCIAVNAATDVSICQIGPRPGAGDAAPDAFQTQDELGQDDFGVVALHLEALAS